MGRGNMATGGTSMGAAHASLVFDTSGLVASAQQARAAGPQIEAALNGIGASAKDAQASVEATSMAMSQIGEHGLDVIDLDALDAATDGLDRLVDSADNASMAMTRIGEHGLEVIDMDAVTRARAEVEELGPAVEQATQQGARGAKELSNELEGVSRSSQTAANGIRQFAGALGITLGFATLIKAGRFALDVDAAATAYRRQAVAARSLAGGQEQLNVLLDAYNEATGDAVDKATALANVTRLQAVGFADSADELTRFVTAARGASIAMGQAQAFIVQELQLTLSNMSERRLDQIGLGIAEVQKRVAELRVANSDLTKEMAFQQAVVDLLIEKYGGLAQSVEGQATGAESAARAWKDWRLAMGEALGPATQSATSWIANWLDADIERTQRWVGWLHEAGRALRGLPQIDPRVGSRGPPLAAVSGTVDRLSPSVSIFPKQAELEAAQVDYWQAIQAIDRQAHTAIQQATEQYGQQRASTVAQFEKSMAREAEDFGRQRARAVAQHERQIADIRESAALREMTAISDLAERIAGLRLDAERRLADATEDFNERRAQQQATYEKRVSELREDGLASIAKIEETAQRERERALRAHRDTLLNAASRLDARAVAQEMRRFATSNAEQERSQAQALKEAKENLAERLEQERENHEQRMAADQAAFDKRNAREARDLQRRIDAEQAAHEKRLADARAADEKRIADQQAAFEEQQAQEDEDRAIRLARQRQDHADQLAEMARAQALRIQQIGEQQAEQRQKLNEAFQAQLAELGLFNRDWLTQQACWQTQATKLFNEMWGDWYKTMEDLHRAEREFAAQMGPHPQPLDFPSLTAPSSMPGGRNPAASTRTVNIASGAIVVNEARRPGETAEEVLRIFERLAN